MVLTPEDQIIRYDGRTLAVNICPVIQVEAHRGRRWGWFGQKGWWVRLHLSHGWQSKKFMLTLSEAGIFLKHNPDELPWITDEQQRPGASHTEQKSSSGSCIWSNDIPLLLL